MYVDALQVVSDQQHVTATALSTNTIDLLGGTPSRRIGEGEEMGFKVAVVAAGVNSGSLQLQAVSSAAAALTAPTVIGELDVVAADLIAGAEFFLFIDKDRPKQEFIGMNYIVTGVVDVTITASLEPSSMGGVKPVSYPKAYKITG